MPLDMCCELQQSQQAVAVWVMLCQAGSSANLPIKLEPQLFKCAGLLMQMVDPFFWI